MNFVCFIDQTSIQINYNGLEGVVIDPCNIKKSLLANRELKKITEGKVFRQLLSNPFHLFYHTNEELKANFIAKKILEFVWNVIDSSKTAVTACDIFFGNSTKIDVYRRMDYGAYLIDLMGECERNLLNKGEAALCIEKITTLFFIDDTTDDIFSSDTLQSRRPEKKINNFLDLKQSTSSIKKKPRKGLKNLLSVSSTLLAVIDEEESAIDEEKRNDSLE